jgi:two-component system chemotaxis response regulator CheB
MNGYEATRKIMETCPAPIVIVSASSRADEIATNFRAIEAGALAVVSTPSGIGQSHYEAATKELLETVKLMSEVKVVRRWPRSQLAPSSLAEPPVQPGKAHAAIRAVVIGASTGGPLALQSLLSRLPKDFAIPVLIVQHMAPGFVYGFAEWLAEASGFPVKVATDGECLEPGHAYVAPDSFQMGIRMGNRVRLAGCVQENGMCPSVSYLFRSAQEAFGSDVAGVLLTGMGKDGAEELKYLRDRGAITFAQDKESCVIFGMPAQAIQIGAVMHVLPPDQIGNALTTIVSKP